MICCVGVNAKNECDEPIVGMCFDMQINSSEIWNSTAGLGFCKETAKIKEFAYSFTLRSSF